MAHVGFDRYLGQDRDRTRISVSQHVLRNLERLWNNMLELSSAVETNLHDSVRALGEHRPDLSDEVIHRQQTISRRLIRLERDCWTALARYQPVASDLRMIATILKVLPDLERLSALAMHLARRASKLAQLPEPVAIPYLLELLAKEALTQVQFAIDALINGDVVLARQIIEADREIDRIYRQVVRELKQIIRKDPQHVDTWLWLINSARNLERVADHATHVSEAVVYLREGRWLQDEPDASPLETDSGNVESDEHPDTPLAISAETRLQSSSYRNGCGHYS